MRRSAIVLACAAAAVALPAPSAGPLLFQFPLPRDFFPPGQAPLYTDPAAPIDDRVEDLLSQMTLDEKVAQTLLVVFDGSQDVPALVAQNYSSTGLGLIYNPTQNTAAGGNLCGYNLTCSLERQNAMQAALISSSRLHIPVSIVAETLHSAIVTSTIFPAPVSLGHSWNATLVELVASAIAAQSRIAGVDRGYAPVLQSTTDPRFGRIDENYGEDPVLVATLGATAYVRGMHQGETGGPSAYLPPDGLVSEAKHFAGYGWGGRDAVPAEVSDDSLFEIYLLPWREYVFNGGRGVMCSHNSVNGVPNHANAALVTGVLRDTFGLVKGFVATDYSDVEQIPSFKVAPNNASGAAYAAITAGVDNDLADFGKHAFAAGLPSLVQSGALPQSYLDRAVANTLRAKFAAGLFDGNCYVNMSLLPQLDSAESRALAREAAAQSIVLAQNPSNFLPLDLAAGTKIKRVAVVGQNGGCGPGEVAPNCAASRALAGGYSNLGARITTVVDALQQASSQPGGGGFSVTFSVGATPDSYNTSLIPAAVQAASAADVVVAVLGDSACGYGCGSCAEGVDADDLDLPGAQMDLLYALVTQSTTPVVLVLVNGRPATFGAGMGNRWFPLNGILSKLAGVLVAWRPGEEGGSAIVDVLGGAVNPSGKLTHTWIRSVGQVRHTSPYLQRWFELKAYYGPDRTIPDTPLFPFGWGLSYTTFATSGLALAASTYSAADVRALVNVSVTVSNTGTRDGAVALQAYYSPGCCTMRSRFQQAMLGFTKVFVPAGGKVTATISSPLLFLAGWDPDSPSLYTVEPVQYTIWVAQTAAELPVETATLTVMAQ
jgi:beta-glucosidase-like glycosyl hydrolase